MGPLQGLSKCFKVSDIAMGSTVVAIGAYKNEAMFDRTMDHLASFVASLAGMAAELDDGVEHNLDHEVMLTGFTVAMLRQVFKLMDVSLAEDLLPCFEYKVRV